MVVDRAVHYKNKISTNFLSSVFECETAQHSRTYKAVLLGVLVIDTVLHRSLY
jgi:hypothetical protein